MSTSLTFLGSSDDEKCVVIQVSDSISESDKAYKSVVVTDNAIEKIDTRTEHVIKGWCV